MTVAKDIAIANVKDVIFPPGDLLSDEPPLETDLHRLQMTLLIQCLEFLWQNRHDFYVSGNLTVYYSPRQLKSEDFRGPDFFVVLGTEGKARKSWVVWEEDGKYPNLIIELLSNSTETTDKGLKKQIYQDIFRTPEYFWFDPDSLELAGFLLLGGSYQPIERNEEGWLWSQQLELYLGVREKNLRFFTSEGELVPTPEEFARKESQRAQEESQRAEEESQRAEEESQRAEEESQRAERLADKLRELGVDPNTL